MFMNRYNGSIASIDPTRFVEELWLLFMAHVSTLSMGESNTKRGPVDSRIPCLYQ